MAKATSVDKGRARKDLGSFAQSAEVLIVGLTLPPPESPYR